MSDPQLERLTEAERRVLRLLAEGHTIKSAAVRIGATPSALNERLREARRKTGRGSSRELARELAAHENSDNFSWVEDGQDVLPSDRPLRAAQWRLTMGVVTMSVIGMTVLAGALSLSLQPTAVRESDPLIGRALPGEPTASQWQARLRAEHRDADWAARVEEVLRIRYEQIALVGGSDDTLRITCASSVCEVAGVIAGGSDRDDGVDSDGVSRTVQELQGKPLLDDLAAQGLKSESTLFTHTATKPERAAFFSYFTRIAT